MTKEQPTATNGWKKRQTGITGIAHTNAMLVNAGTKAKPANPAAFNGP